MADIFISYSRLDKAFVEQLRNALIATGRTVWTDTNDIMPTSQWQQDIFDAIETASTVLFILSPDWIVSEICQRELQYATQMQKKLIPVVIRDIDHRTINPTLAQLNWIFSRPNDDQSQAFQQILFAINTDLTYWREGSDILVKSRQWELGSRRPAYTLRGEALRKAEQWLAQGAVKQPGPTKLQVEYINAGRRASAQRQRALISGLSIGVVVTLILSIVAGVFAYQTNQANIQLGGDAIANVARSQYANNNIDRALLLAEAAYHIQNEPATRNALFSLVYQSPHLRTLLSTSNTGQVVKGLGTSTDGRYLDIIGDSSIVVYDFSTQSVQQVRVPGDEIIESGALSPDGQMLALKTSAGAGSTAETLSLINSLTGKLIRPLEGVSYERYLGNKIVHNLTFSPDGSSVASVICPDQACRTTQITVWNVATGQQSLQIPGTYPFSQESIAFSADGHRLAFTEASTAGSRCSVWDLLQHQMIFDRTATFDNRMTAVAFSNKDDSILAIGEDTELTNEATFWNITTKSTIGRPIITNDVNDMVSINFTANMTWMITANHYHTIRLWRITTDFSVATPIGAPLSNGDGNLTALIIAPDNQDFFSANSEGAVTMWNVAPIPRLSPSGSLSFVGAPALAFGTDNASLAYTSLADQTIKVWNAVKGAITDDLPFPATLVQNRIPPDKIVFSPDNQRIAAGDPDGSIFIMNRTTQQVEGSVWKPTPAKVASSLQFSPDGQRLLTCDAVVDYCFVWDVHTHALLHTFGDGQDLFVTSAAFSPNGNTIAVAYARLKENQVGIAIYDTQGQHILKDLIFPAPLPLLQVVWAPDNVTLASIDVSGQVSMWNSTTQRLPTQILKEYPPAALSPTPLSFYTNPPGAAASKSTKWLQVGYGRHVDLWQIDEQTNNTAPYTASLYFDTISTENSITDAIQTANANFLAIGELPSGQITVRSFNPKDWKDEACSIANRNLTENEWEQFIKPFSGKPFSFFAHLCF